MKTIIEKPFLRDNFLNAFGDFHTLGAEIWREGDLMWRYYYLKGEAGVKPLTETEFAQCCESLFFQ